MGAPRGGPRREKGKRGWGVEQTHSFTDSFIHSALDYGASTGVCAEGPRPWPYPQGTWI